MNMFEISIRAEKDFIVTTKYVSVDRKDAKIPHDAVW